ncbi:unnamed protein product [Paramecium sonneborni]|uniref:Uncharacterized protein n=1 Tax=Paramecium sonneborni TaxID=65129 RepID=A0A8S1PWA8_9CILI|nr:unnamed protein product [Paramecium sonneborni]
MIIIVQNWQAIELNGFIIVHKFLKLANIMKGKKQEENQNRSKNVFKD